MKNTTKKLFALLIAAVFCLGFLAGCGDSDPEAAAQALLDEAKVKFEEKADYEGFLAKCNEVKESYPDTAVAKTVDKFITDETNTAIQVKAPALIAAYDKNEVSADEKYKGKLIIVTGTIQSIDSGSTTYIHLKDSDKYSFMSVMCSFTNEAEIAKIAKLAKGKKVKIIGVGDGVIIGSPNLDDCFLL